MVCEFGMDDFATQKDFRDDFLSSKKIAEIGGLV
jgi:hypothetical protein